MKNLLRRAITIPWMLLAWCLAWVSLPLWLALTLLIDSIWPGAGRWPRTRASLFFLLYLSCEAGGLIVAGALGVLTVGGRIVGRRRYLDLNAGLQRGWSGALFWGAVRIFGMRVVCEDQPASYPGPHVLLVRHASTADTVLAAALLANPYRIMFRYVIKQELLWDPCLDVVGHRLPNAFIDRSSSDRAGLVRAVAGLAEGLDAASGVLVFPEGTRFSPHKLRQAQAALASDDHSRTAQAVRALRHCLPPRIAGARALMDAAPGATLSILGHTGFEAARSFREFWGGGLIHRTIHTRLWQFAPGQVPRDDFEAWLTERWRIMDAWIDQQQVPVSGAAQP